MIHTLFALRSHFVHTLFALCSHTDRIIYRSPNEDWYSSECASILYCMWINNNNNSMIYRFNLGYSKTWPKKILSSRRDFTHALVYCMWITLRRSPIRSHSRFALSVRTLGSHLVRTITNSMRSLTFLAQIAYDLHAGEICKVSPARCNSATIVARPIASVRT
jgi:hypothetical protein